MLRRRGWGGLRGFCIKSSEGLRWEMQVLASDEAVVNAWIVVS
jgi:hypothetical protein